MMEPMPSKRPGAPPSSTGAITGLLVLQAVLLGLVGVRLWLTRQSELGHDPCLSCQAATLVQHDAGLWVLVWAGLLLAGVLAGRARWLAAPGWVLAVAVLALLAVDVAVLWAFDLRLFLADVFKFGGQPGYVVDYLVQHLGYAGLAAGLLALGVAVWALWRLAARGMASRASRVWGGGLLALAAVLYLLPDRVSHVLPWTYQNVIEANWRSGADTPYSEFLARELLATDDAGERRCGPGQARGGDVIIVLVESLSWYHGGLMLEENLGVTPRLDALARENAWWPAFHANGWTTDHGLIALLGGALPLPAINRYRSMQVFEGYASGPDTLPARLGADGWHTAFFTSGDLAFLGKRDWLEDLGFERVEGNEHPGYEGLPRYAFGAADDAALFDRVLRWLDAERPADRPVAAVVETVGTHPPFVDPETGLRDEAAAFRFTDRALGDFVAALGARGWLEGNLLIVTSDQRALTPVTPAESETFGVAAGARLPLVAIGGAMRGRGRVATAAQMLDLPYSLDHWLTAEACRAPGQGNWFADEAPDCIFQPEGNQRDIVNAFCGEDAARIRLDGDDTRVIEGRLPDEDRRLRELNRQRIRLGERDVDIHRVL